MKHPVAETPQASASGGYRLLVWEQAQAYMGPGTTIRGLKRLVYSNQIESIRFGGRRLIPQDALDAYIARQRSEGGR